MPGRGSAARCGQMRWAARLGRCDLHRGAGRQHPHDRLPPEPRPRALRAARPVAPNLKTALADDDATPMDVALVPARLKLAALVAAVCAVAVTALVLAGGDSAEHSSATAAPSPVAKVPTASAKPP